MSKSKIQDLDKTYSTMRTMTMASLAIVLVTSIFFVLTLRHAYGTVGQRVYVVGSLGTQAAVAASPDEHSEFEYRNVVRTFVSNMFQHDESTFTDHMNTALNLSDALSGRRLYEEFKKGQVYENYRKFGSRTMVKVDSIVLQNDVRPRTGKVYMKQKTFMADRQSAPISIAAAFTLVETDRSEKNPYGIQISGFDFIPYNAPISAAEQAIQEQQAERDRQQLQAAQQAAKQAAAAEAAIR
ncbi:hypothetical protein KLP40_14585 [Hymenobacter sp. NST-14]|uniref:hypothetical protein n=1 Tax=Hymenobacter piscis TaxID=2839984 RepID=UPI001C01498C|nr:hypothetical protein [Hymenobacter piscis]MBT9394395.1 hypothetical protein [Hymenobacter piscis]